MSDLRLYFQSGIYQLRINFVKPSKIWNPHIFENKKQIRLQQLQAILNFWSLFSHWRQLRSSFSFWSMSRTNFVEIFEGMEVSKRKASPVWRMREFRKPAHSTFAATVLWCIATRYRARLVSRCRTLRAQPLRFLVDFVDFLDGLLRRSRSSLINAENSFYVARQNTVKKQVILTMQKKLPRYLKPATYLILVKFMWNPFLETFLSQLHETKTHEMSFVITHDNRELKKKLQLKYMQQKQNHKSDINFGKT